MNQKLKQHINNINKGIIPKGYKKTKLGIIPEEWELHFLRDCIDTTGKYGINAPSVEFDKDLPKYLRITDINENGNYDSSKKVSVKSNSFHEFILKEGDIVFARTGNTTGKSYLYSKKDGELVYAGFLIKFFPNALILNVKYLKFYTSTSAYWNWVQTMSVRSGQPGINAKEYGALSIPLPPLPEQQKIANILTTWDKAIELKEQLIEQKQAQKKGLMQNLLTGKIRLKGFTEEWKDVKLGDVSDITMGQSPSSNDYNDNGEGKYLIQGNADIKNRQSKPRIWTKVVTKECMPNDILMTVRAPVGAIAISKHNACIGRGVCAINPKHIDHDFLYNWLVNFEQKWKKFEQGSTFTAVNSKDLRNLKIKCSNNKKEQEAIANILTTSDKELELLNQELESLKEQKKGLMQLLLTGKVRVEA